MIHLYIGPEHNELNNLGYTHPLVQYLSAGSEKLAALYHLNSSLEHADFALLPLAIEYYSDKKNKQYVEKFILEAKKNIKPVLVFSTGDFGTTLKKHTVFTLRLGGFDSKLDNRTEIMSPFFLDPILVLNKEFKVLSKTKVPTIGFVGHADAGLIKFVKEFALFLIGNFRRIVRKDGSDYQQFYPSSYYRMRYLKLVQKNNNLKANFIFRRKYRAGAITQMDKELTSYAFYNNIFENQYVFCLRGSGNFSVRFYETLALGRIPILINTDCRLPFLNQIDWSQHCLIVNENEVNEIGDKIVAFHSSLSDENFQQIQKSNRMLWEKYFTKENYFVQYYNELINN